MQSATIKLQGQYGSIQISHRNIPCIRQFQAHANNIIAYTWVALSSHKIGGENNVVYTVISHIISDKFHCLFPTTTFPKRRAKADWLQLPYICWFVFCGEEVTEYGGGCHFQNFHMISKTAKAFQKRSNTPQ